MVNKSRKELYHPICQIGKGACGAVYLVRNTDDKKLYALKKVQLDESRRTRTREAVQREANIMAEMKHPHIVSYHDSYYMEEGEHNFLYIVQDYCDGGTLEDRIQEAIMKKHYIPEKLVIQWFLQIAMAVRYMHSKRVLHRDLKTANVFMNKSGTILKLGISTALEKQSSSREAYTRDQDAGLWVKKKWFLQIAMAVRYMHSKRVLHRDLKTANVFMNKSGTILKLGDFGIAKSLDKIEVANTCVGTPCYLSPEMCQDIPYSSKADVWALGCMLYEMLSLKPAFDANNLVSLFYKIVKGDYDPIPEFYSEDMNNLVAHILVKSPDERPSARGVLTLPYTKAELLKYIEEKELLRKRKLPTRQGSRPYSTSCLSRSLIAFFEEQVANGADIPVIPQKRATSCRPAIADKLRERSLLSARGKPGRVSTIPEEPEDEAARNMRILQQIEANNMDVIQEVQDTPRDPPPAPTREVKDTKKQKQNVDLDKAPQKTRVTPTLKNAHMPESPRQAVSNNKNSAKSSVSDNKGPKRVSTPSGEHKDQKDQKVAKKSQQQQQQQPSSSKSSNNRSTTPHKSKENSKKDASRETSKTPSKDKDPKVLSKSAKITRDSNNTSSKKGGVSGSSTSNRASELSKSMGHKQLTNSSPHISAQNDYPVGSSGGNTSSTHSNSNKENDHHTKDVPEDIEMVDKPPELDLVNEKLVSLSQSEPNMADLSRHSKVVRKNSQNKLETNDEPKVVVIEEVTAIAPDSARSVTHNDPSLPSVTGMEHLVSQSNESLPPIFSKSGMIAKDQQRPPRSSINADTANLVDGIGAPRQVGMITKNVKQFDGLPKLIIQQNEGSHSRRSSGRRGSLRRSAGKHGKRRQSGKLKMSDSIGDRPSTRDSLLSIPYDPSFDYYSDDFDDLETESDISEAPSDTENWLDSTEDITATNIDLEVPEEEMIDLRKHVRKMSTQTFELPADIEEDLPGGQLGLDDDYVDDFEDDFEENVDDYDEILSVARELCNDLDEFHKHDELIMDHESRRPSANVVLKQQFIDAMGKEKYHKVKAYFDNHEEIEIKKVEKMVGKEHLKTALMMKGKK